MNSKALISPETPSAHVRLAVIGAGLGATPHFKSLADLATQAEVAWVCGRSAERLAAVQTPQGAHQTTRIEDILEDKTVQAVLVLTPAHTHLDMVRRVASAGKHVLVEKPLEIDLHRATVLVESCEANGVMLGIMLQHRLREAALGLSAWIKSGELGSLVSASASVRWWRPQSYYSAPGRGTLARDGGGVLITQAIHTLDLLLSLIGLPVSVHGVTSTSPVHTMECEDTAVAMLQFATGAVAVVQATTAAYPGFPERLELNFSRATATLESGKVELVFVDGKTLTLGASEASGGGADPMAFDHGAHRTVLQDFIQAVQNGRPPAITGRSALGVQRVIEAIMTSSRTNRTVWLDSNAHPKDQNGSVNTA